MAVTLYHVEWCPDCEVVRNRLSELNIPYEDIVVPDFRPMRTVVYDVSGQYYVPVLKDGDTVLTETDDILAHLDQRYDKADQ
jgi:glutathione S-transferase